MSLQCVFFPCVFDGGGILRLIVSRAPIVSPANNGRSLDGRAAALIFRKDLVANAVIFFPFRALSVLFVFFIVEANVLLSFSNPAR